MIDMGYNHSIGENDDSFAQIPFVESEALLRKVSISNIYLICTSAKVKCH